jgi:hypothetical protein
VVACYAVPVLVVVVPLAGVIGAFALSAQIISPS